MYPPPMMKIECSGTWIFRLGFVEVPDVFTQFEMVKHLFPGEDRDGDEGEDDRERQHCEERPSDVVEDQQLQVQLHGG